MPSPKVLLDALVENITAEGYGRRAREGRERACRADRPHRLTPSSKLCTEHAGSMMWVERAALSRQICPSAAARCCQGWLSLGEIKWRSTKASRGRGARMIDLGAQTCNLDVVFGLLHERPPDRRMVSAPARAPNIGAPHHRSQPHHRDRCRRYRPSATLSRSADSITAVQGKKRGASRVRTCIFCAHAAASPYALPRYYIVMQAK